MVAKVYEPDFAQKTGERESLLDVLAESPELSRIVLRGSSAILEEAAKPIEWVWEGLVAKGNVALLSGMPGGGKTTLLFLILAALGSDVPVELLGATVRPMRPDQYIVLIEAEQSRPSTARKLVRSCKALGVGLGMLDRILILARASVVVGDARWLEVEALAAQGLVAHVALDTLARVAPGDGSSEEAQTRTMARVGALTVSSPSLTTVWMLTHNNKREPTGTVNDVSGAAARAGGVDSVALVTSNLEDGRFVSVTLAWPKTRDREEARPDPVSYTLVGDVLTIVDNPSKGKREPKSKDRRSDVFADVLAHQGTSGNAVIERIRGDRNGILAAIQSLLAERVVVREEGKLYVPSEDGELPHDALHR